MKKAILNNKQLVIINALFTFMIIAQESKLIDVFPIIDDSWKIFLKTIIAVIIATYNAYKLNNVFAKGERPIDPPTFP